MFGSRGDRTGSETSGIPRRINRQKLDRFVLEEEIQTAHSLRNCVWNGLKNLLRIRRSRPVFHPQAVQRVLSADSRLFTLWRIPLAGDVRMLCLHNVSPQTVDIGGLLDGLPASSSWTDAITGRRYRAGAAGSAELAGFHTLWLESGSKS